MDATAGAGLGRQGREAGGRSRGAIGLQHPAAPALGGPDAAHHAAASSLLALAGPAMAQTEETVTVSASRIVAEGFVAPTPIQAGAIPAILQGVDLLGAAQTGSGKTAAFALPLLQQLQLSATGGPRRVRALVLVPTRELAAQVGEVLRSLITCSR